MRNPTVVIGIIFVLSMALSPNPAKAEPPSKSLRSAYARQSAKTAGLQFPNLDPGHHVAWVTESLKRMETIHVGMTRAKLMTVFTTEGGTSTREQQEFVYQGCPYFKVDVTFKPVGSRKTIPIFEVGAPADIIVHISRPYLQWSIYN